MTYKEISDLVESIGLPFAYNEFPEGTDTAPPFVCFLIPDSVDFLADGKNYVRIRPLVIELYTDNKDFALEEQVETALNTAGLVYSRSETYIGSERMFQISYTTSVYVDDVATTTEE